MTILDTIIGHKREEVALAKKERDMSRLRAMPEYNRPGLSLHEALLKQDVGIIAEIKKASPSKGVIRKNFDPVAIAKAYACSGAAAISVLTDEKFFQGSLEYLLQVHHCVNLPVLRKDFIIDAYQLHEAKAYGADAVLLIVAALGKEQLHDLHREAQMLELDVLVEVHNEKEIEMLDFGCIKLIGINNRDLATFKVDIALSLRLKKKLPQNVVCVSESGIESAADIRALHPSGISSFLIGETFMRASDPGAALGTLLEEAKR